MTSSKIVLDIVISLSVIRGDKSYMLTIKIVLGGVDIKQCENGKTTIETHVFMYTSIFVIDYLNKEEVLLSYLHSVIFLVECVIFICFGKVSFLGTKVGKHMFSPFSVFILCSVNSSSCSAAICFTSLVTLNLEYI